VGVVGDISIVLSFRGDIAVSRRIIIGLFVRDWLIRNARWPPMGGKE